MNVEQVLNRQIVEVPWVDARTHYYLVLCCFQSHLIRDGACLRSEPCLALLDLSHYFEHVKAATLGQPVVVLH
jgi:hypothetical protein